MVIHQNHHPCNHSDDHFHRYQNCYHSFIILLSELWSARSLGYLIFILLTLSFISFLSSPASSGLSVASYSCCWLGGLNLSGGLVDLSSQHREKQGIFTIECIVYLMSWSFYTKVVVATFHDLFMVHNWSPSRHQEGWVQLATKCSGATVRRSFWPRKILITS